MRTSIALCVLAALFISGAGARAEDCKQLAAPSEQIACLQRQVDTLRGEVELLRSMAPVDQSIEQLVDEKIRRAVTDMEERLEKKTEPRVQLLRQ